jgi:hypothetical protein
LKKHLQETGEKKQVQEEVPKMLLSSGWYLKTKNKLRGLQSAGEIFRLSDSHLWAKFSANFCG